MNIHLTRRDVIWSYIGTIMSIGSNLLLLPFIVHYLDEDMLGLWYVFTSIGAIATLFDCGFSVTFARNITYCWGGAKKLQKEDVEQNQDQEVDFYLMKKLLTTCKIIYFLLSFGALIFLLVFGTIYIRHLTGSIYGYVPLIAWLIYAMAAFLNLYFGYYSSFLRGVGAVDEANINTIIAKGIQIVLTISLLVCGTGLIGACVAYLAYGTVFRVLGKYKFYRYNNIGEELSKIKDKYTRKDLKELFSIVWHNAWRDGIISVCNYFSNQITTVICSMYLTLAETGIYSLGVQIAQAIATISGTLYTTYQPALQEAYLNKDLSRTRKVMSIIVISFTYLFAAGSISALTVGIPLLKILKPTTELTHSILFGLLIYQFMLKFRNCYTSYFSCTNRIIYLRAFIISAVLCTVLSFVFIGPMSMGIVGLILAQIISQLYNFIHWPIKAHKEISLSLPKMFTIGTKSIRDMVLSVKKRRKT